MFSGHGLELLRCIGPRQQVVDLALRVASDNAGDDVGEVSLWIDAVELAGLDERSDDGPVLAAAVGAGEERAFLRFRAIGRMARSTTLESISTRPSSRKRLRPFQRASA